MSRTGSDFRYAFRTIVRGGSVTALAIVAFALGIGVTTAVFSIFNSVQDPIGRRVAPGSTPDASSYWQVIGVVRNIRSYGLVRDAP